MAARDVRGFVVGCVGFGGILEGLETNGRAELGSVLQSLRILIDGVGFDASARISICFCCTIQQLTSCLSVFHFY